jgi:YfiH family protein
LGILVKNGIKYFVFENLSRAGVRHAFSTRVGGVSSGVYASLNLGLKSGDDMAALRENYRLICDALGFDVDGIVLSSQTHSTNICAFGAPGGLKPAREDVDGLMTNVPGLVLATYYADCVPLFFYDPRARVVANSHAGWRGCAQNMAGKTIFAMQKQYNCRPADILAGIGPSISVKNFEVGKEVADIFKKELPFSDKFIYNSISVNKYYVDLWEICRESLLEAGVKPENIEIAGLCTYERADLFYSHRRDGIPRGNMAGMISL